MASPFSVFRSNLKPLMVVLTLLSLFAFVALPALQMYLQYRVPGQGNLTVATYNGGSYDMDEINYYQTVLGLTNRFLASVAEEVQAAGGVPQVPGYGPVGQGQTQRMSYGISVINTPTNVVLTKLYAREAEKLGLQLDDTAVDIWMERFADNKLSARQLAGLRARASQNRLGQSQMYELLKTELLANMYERMMTSALATGQSLLVSPVEAWQNFLKLNRQAKAVAYPVLVEDYLENTSEPSQATLLALYEEGKDRFPSEQDPEPGFARYYAADLEYVAADLEKFIERETAQLSEEQLRAEYQRRLEGGEFQMPPMNLNTTTPAPSQPPATPPTGETPPAAGDPTAEDPTTEDPANEAPPAGEDQPTGDQQSASEEQPPSEAEAGGDPANAEGSAQPDAPAEPPASEDEPTSGDKPTSEDKPTGEDKPGEDKPTGEDKPIEDEAAAEQQAAGGDTPSSGDGAASPPDASARATVLVNAALQEENPQPPAEASPSEPSPAEETPTEQPPASEEPAPAEQPAPAEEPTAEEPTAEQQPTAEEPSPAEQPPAETAPAEASAEGAPESGTATPAGDEPSASDDAATEDASAGDGNAIDPPAGEETTPPEPPSFEQARDQIAREMVLDEAREARNEALLRVTNAMRAYADEMAYYRDAVKTDSSLEEPERPDLEALAEQHGLDYGRTGLIDAMQALDTPIGKSRVRSGQSLVDMLFTPERPNFYTVRTSESPSATTQSGGGVEYVAWKVEGRDSYVPELDEIREEVVAAAKRLEAQELAREAAEELAVEANASPDTPLAELVPENRKNLVFADLGPFPWMQFFGFGNPIVATVPELDNVGEDFMRAVFRGGPVGQYRVGPNQPRTVFYVVKPTEITPPAEELRPRFMQSNQRSIAAMMAGEDMRDVRNSFEEQFRESVGLEWNEEALQ